MVCRKEKKDTKIQLKWKLLFALSVLAVIKPPLQNTNAPSRLESLSHACQSPLDWNFAYTHAEATYITIAHQDDIYCRDFARCTVQTLDRVPKPILSFTDYGEDRIHASRYWLSPYAQIANTCFFIQSLLN